MDYYLGFWTGPAPRGPHQACAPQPPPHAAVTHALDETGEAPPPVPAIAGFMCDVHTAFPACEAGADRCDDASIWMDHGWCGRAHGQAAMLTLTLDGAIRAREEIAEIAQRWGLNAFDIPQHRLLPDERPDGRAGEDDMHPDVLPEYLDAHMADPDPLWLAERKRFSIFARHCEGHLMGGARLGVDRPDALGVMDAYDSLPFMLDRMDRYGTAAVPF